MKQGRLSFSTKRKDRAEEAENVIVIPESPEKPPPKKVCRKSVAESADSVEEKDLPNGGEKSPPRKHSAESPTDCDEAKKLEVPTVEEAAKPETESEKPDDSAKTQGRPRNSAEAVNPVSKSIPETDGAEGDGEEVMDVSIAESSLLDSTIGSTQSENSDNDEKSDSTTPTAPKRARLSKTEAAFRSLQHRKDKELRQKEKDEKLKQRQEEKERREQERKELKDKKEKERLERERKKEEERLEREKKKEEERLQKEKERVEREKKKEEERLQKEKERIEREKKKEEERLEKEKEKEEKEKLRKEKEDERRRREDEKKRELEEESAKKEKAKQAFMSFFVKRTSTSNSDAAKDPTTPGGDPANDDESHRAENVVKFRPFQLKKDMKLAPIVPEDAKNRFDRDRLESKLRDQNAKPDGLYVKLLRQGYKPLKSNRKKIENQEPEDQDVIIITRFDKGDDESSGGRMRAKFLHFCENFRPAYYGTWRKKCPQINGRKPFNKYNDFDYTVDSDDEWEEGEGESLAGTDDEKEEKDEVEEDYEEDDFLVPHGYLSESEEDEEDDQPMDPEALKARIAARQEEFTADRKAGLQKKKIVAVCALGPDGVALQEEIKVLSQFKAVLMVANGLQPSWERENELIINSKDAEPAVLTAKALELFCRTAHGFQGGTRALYDTFLQKWKAVSDVRVSHKSLKMTLASYCKRSKSLNALFVDSQQLVEKFGLENLVPETTNDGTPQSSRFLPDDVIPELIKVVHGNSNVSQIMEDFLALMADRKFGKAQVKRTLANLGEFNQTQKCWLVKDECLKEHGLEDLKIEKLAKKETKEEKTGKVKDPSKPKDEKKPKESGDDLKISNKENDDSKDSAKLSVVESPKVDAASSANPDNTTPRRVSIKSFFTPKTKKTPTTPTTASSSSSKVLAPIVLKESASSPRAAETSADKASVTETPKAKKRVQLTTLSRTPTMKEEKKSQAVLEKDELIVIDESN